MRPVASLHSRMDAALAGESASVARSEREDWLRRCEAAYLAVYRGLIAMGSSEPDAADAVQDAFEDALRQRKPVALADGWLFVVALRHLRRSRWRRRIFRPLASVRATITGEYDDNVDLLRELARLTDRQRTVVVARYVIGLTQAEIAELLRIAPGTVAATAHQATALLRERLLGGTK